MNSVVIFTFYIYDMVAMETELANQKLSVKSRDLKDDVISFNSYIKQWLETRQINMPGHARRSQ